jgi:uncharacterized protein YutE (UPF0331/DUF86 family)
MDDLENNILNRLFIEMDESLQKLRTLAKVSRSQFLNNYEKIDTAKYNFIVAIESMIDISNRVISAKKLGYPQDYAEVIKLMGQKGGFEEGLVKRLIEMVKFRNMLVHLYWKIEDERLCDYVKKKLDGFEEFRDAVRRYLKSGS